MRDYPFLMNKKTCFLWWLSQKSEKNFPLDNYRFVYICVRKIRVERGLNIFAKKSDNSHRKCFFELFKSQPAEGEAISDNKKSFALCRLRFQR